MEKMTPINEFLVAKLVSEQGDRIGDLIDQARDLAEGRLPFSDKASGLLDIAESLCKTITPYTPCVKGCNHCCFMAVSVSSYEAEMISRYTGKPLATSGKGVVEMAITDIREKYTGVPCTLLKDGKCSVYPVRPAVCRTHHNLAVDEENCKIYGGNLEELPTTPSINLTQYSLIQSLTMLQGGCTFADIREFFPAE